MRGLQMEGNFDEHTLEFVLSYPPPILPPGMRQQCPERCALVPGNDLSYADKVSKPDEAARVSRQYMNFPLAVVLIVALFF